MPTLLELEAMPEFKKLNFDEQNLMRVAYLQNLESTDPEFQSLSPQDRTVIYQEVLNRAPILEVPESDYLRNVSANVERLKAGDQAAIGDLIRMDALRLGSKQLLIPTLVSKGVDAVASFFDPDRSDPLYNDYYGADGEKVSAWLQMQLDRYGGEGTSKDIASSAMAIGLVGGFAEFGLMTLGLGAIGGAIGGATGNAAKGASIGRGILTGEYLNTATQAAMKATKLSAPLIRNLTAITVEGVQSGLTQTGLDMLRIGLQDGFKNKTSNEVWSRIAQEYGTNIAFNYVGWGIMKAAGVVARAGAKALRTVKLPAQADVLSVFRAGDNELARSMSKSFAEDVMVPSEVAARMGALDPKGETAFKVLSQAHGWDAVFDSKGKASLVSISNPEMKLSSLDRKAATNRLAEIIATGEPAIELKPSEVGSSLKNQALFASDQTKALRRATYELGSALEPQHLVSLLYPENGAVSSSRLKTFGKSYLMAQGVSEGFAQKLEVAVRRAAGETSSGTRIVVDATALSSADERKLIKGFLDELDEIASKAKGVDVASLKKIDIRLPEITENPGSATAIEAAAAKFGIPFKQNGTKVSIGGVEFASTREASAGLMRAAYDGGQLSFDQIATIVQRSSGLTLEKTPRPVISPRGKAEALAKRVHGKPEMEVPNFTLSKPTASGKKLVASAVDLDTLFREHPEVDVRLPSTFAPNEWIVDSSLKKVMIGSNVAVGEATQLLETMGNFSALQTPKEVFSLGKDVVVKEVGDAGFYIKNDILGVFAKVDSPVEAKKLLTSGLGEVEKMKLAFGMRDMKVSYAIDGSLIGVGVDGSTKRFATLAEAQTWLKEHPLATWVTDILPVDPALRSELDEAAKGLYDAAMPVRKRGPSAFTDAVGKVAFPTEMSLEVSARRFKDTTLLENYKELTTGLRLVQAADTKADAQISQIFKKVTPDEKVMYQVLLGHDQKMWNKISQDMFHVDLNEKHLSKLAEIENYYEAAFKAAGIPEWKKVLNYAPRIREWTNKNLDTIADTMTTKEFFENVFGHVPAGFAFFGEKIRASDLVRFSLQEDAENVMKQYTYNLNKHRLMDKLFKDFKGNLKTLEGKFPKSDLNYVAASIDEFQSYIRSPQARVVSEATRNGVLKVQDFMRKVPLLRSTPFAKNEVIGDVFDLMNTQITFATQAKPWAIFRNMTQVYLLGATIGDNKVMWDAFRKVVQDTDDNIIKKLLDKGVIQGTGFIHAEADTGLSLWRRMMKWNENMDIITRATAFVAAEDLIDEWWPRFKKGTLDAKTFVKRSGISVLDDPTRLKLVDALNRNDLKYAKLLYGDSLNKLTFFDYSKINRAGFQRGLLGKVVGKFGTFPASTLALYQRILTTGSAAERVARASRFVITSTALYYGAKAVGISYPGFLWTDPFGFQGGPIWQLLADGSRVVGQNAENKIARASLLRDLPRLMSPTLNTFTQVQRTLQHLDNDDIYSAALALMGVPVRRDVEWAERSSF